MAREFIAKRELRTEDSWRGLRPLVSGRGERDTKTVHATIGWKTRPRQQGSWAGTQRFTPAWVQSVPVPLLGDSFSAERDLYSPRHKGHRAEVSSENQVEITTIDRARIAVTGNGRGT